MKQHESKSLIGTNVGNFKVLRWDHKVGKNNFYEIECSQGHRYISDYRVFKKSKCKKCNFGPNSPHWKGVGDLSLEFFGRYRLNAIKKGFEFNLTIEEAWDQFVKQNKKCALTGIELKIEHKSGDFNQSTLSLDRIDSKRGYEKENIQWVHKAINLIKRHYPQDFFIAICNLITQNHPIQNIENIDIEEGLKNHSSLVKNPNKGNKHHRSKEMIIEMESGQLFIIKGLSEFCNKNNLSYDCLRSNYTKKNDNFHKGFKIKEILN